MGTLRKANAYSKRKVTPYTRTSKRRQRAYIKMVPPQKIVKFTMGKEGDFNQGKLPYVLTVISDDNVQIRHNALEACRQFINKQLATELNDQFLFKVIPFPHHIQRENKMITGAGADRMQTGMQLSFGKAIGKSAIVKQGQKIFVIATATPKSSMFTRNVIKQIKSKLPCRIRILSEDLTKTKKSVVKE